MLTYFSSTMAATLLLLAGCGGGSSDDQAPEDRLQATTETGQIRGATKLSAGINADVFLGIPYAAPPVGNLRWAAPARAQAWQGVRDGTIAPPVCPQGISTLSTSPGVGPAVTHRVRPQRCPQAISTGCGAGPQVTGS